MACICTRFGVALVSFLQSLKANRHSLAADFPHHCLAGSLALAMVCLFLAVSLNVRMQRPTHLLELVPANDLISQASRRILTHLPVVVEGSPSTGKGCRTLQTSACSSFAPAEANLEFTHFVNSPNNLPSWALEVWEQSSAWQIALFKLCASGP